MTEETIVAVYDTAAHADEAIKDLLAANVPAGAISRHAGTATGTGLTSGSAQTASPAREPGFWNSLFGGEPDHDTSVYDRSMDSGSTVVTVRAPDEHVESVSRILELHNPIDLDQGATGYNAGNAATSATPPTADTIVAAQPAAAAAGNEGVISLAEEQLVVGKRLVNRGTTRVRRYVVETPVEENVTLRDERVSIERRPVSAGAHTTDTAFTDRVVEVTETGEEAVVGKSVHVKEEVVVRKDAAEHVETIRDTVRHEDIEVERIPGPTTTGTGTGTGTGTVSAPDRLPKV